MQVAGGGSASQYRDRPGLTTAPTWLRYLTREVVNVFGEEKDEKPGIRGGIQGQVTAAGVIRMGDLRNGPQAF